MHIEVYLETKKHSELIATFSDEATFLACLPVLEELAINKQGVITESIKEA